MFEFCGYINKNKSIENENIIKAMTDVLKLKETDSKYAFIEENIAFGGLESSGKILSKSYFDNMYTIIYSGNLYNKTELTHALKEKGYSFSQNSDCEIVLAAYIEYGDLCVNYFNGTFAFLIYNKQKNNLFLARDRLGIKPLFYSLQEDKTFVFSSKIKSVLKHEDINPILDKEGLMELIGLGPAHTPGKTYFKNIKELKAGHTANFSDFKLKEEKYWDLQTKPCGDDESTAISKIHSLLKDSAKKQLNSDKPICCMLSGGLDSSILSKLAKDNNPDLSTFSIDFVGNDDDFKSNEYQLTKDSDYVKIMQKFLSTNHTAIKLDNTHLFDLLKDALIARDMPGMADIDSSMLAFCKNIKSRGFDTCFSGECSDEIFGGYPWFYKENLINHDGFPWALSEDLRCDLIKKDLLKENELRGYIKSQISKTLKNVSLTSDDEFENKFRQVNYLTIKWFMNTLLERSNTMSSASSLEVRVPFADHRIFEYVYNLPAKMKLGLLDSSNPTEKFLLKKAFESELPKDIVHRKKSPFPKTYDPVYLSLVENKMRDILSNKNSKLHLIINTDYVQSLLDSHGTNLTQNLFGQLMSYPQTIAFLIQIDMWLDLYNVEIEI